MAEEFDPQDPQRRKHPRFAVDMEAKVLTALGTHKARTRDLSRGGLCFVLPMPLKVGMDFSIEMSLIFGENTFSEPLTVPGKIIWCTPVEGGYQMGASFLSTDGQTKQYLEMFLNFLANGVDDEGEDAEVPEDQAEMEEEYEDDSISFVHESGDSGLFS